MQPGAVLAGRYRLERKLGQGGMGSVYAATDLSFRRSVAIKVLHPEAAADSGQSSRFELEARAIASLGHPHIATLHDFHAAADPTPFLVIELIEGETLRGLLGRERTLAPARAMHIGRQILSALAAAHRAGIIHRDIKPSNVMLMRSGTTGDFVKLVDFGIAKMAEGTTRRHHTAEGSVVGTLQYMPPEQALGLPVTPSADLYAVGVCLFEMLAGYNPFAVGEMAAVFAAVRDLQPPDLRQIRPDVPAALAIAIGRALAKQPQLRPGSADELAAILEDAPATFTTAGPPSFTTAGPPSFTTAGPPAGSRRGLVWLIVALVVALLAVSGVAGALLLRAPPAPVQAPVAGPSSAASAPMVVATADAGSTSAAASPSTPPRPAGKQSTSRSDAGAAPGKPPSSQRCLCTPNPDQTPPDRSRLCRGTETPACSCQAQNYRLCTMQYRDEGVRLVCPDNSDQIRPMPGAKHGAACFGYQNATSPRVQGQLTCSVCTSGFFPGNDGEACIGYHERDGSRWKGTLSSCD